MRLFIDTVDIGEIATASSWGIVDGVTIDRAVLDRDGCDLKCLLAEICRAVDGPVTIEVVSTESDRIVREAREMASWRHNAVMAVPITTEGVKAVRRLSDDGMRTSVTRVHSPAQSLLAAKAGATYIAVPLGSGAGGMEVVARTVEMIETYGFGSEVIACGITDVSQVIEAVHLGAHAAAVPFEIMEQLFRWPYSG